MRSKKPDKKPDEYVPVSAASKPGSSGSLAGGGIEEAGGGAAEGGGGDVGPPAALAGGGAAEGGGGVPPTSEEGGGAPPLRVAWLAGTVTLPEQVGHAKDWPAMESSAVSSVWHVGHANLRSIRPSG